MDDAQKYTEGKKPITKDHMLYDLICIKCPEEANL